MPIVIIAIEVWPNITAFKLPKLANLVPKKIEEINEKTIINAIKKIVLLDINIFKKLFIINS
tara:strand:+ start:401 stop:586 length:186 start_codon:yes stop_codon:yes gene_type:complete